MARITINTRDCGPLEFFVPTAGGYVRLESAGRSGTLGRQICDGGGFMGNTLTASPESLHAVASGWIRQARADARRNDAELADLL